MTENLLASQFDKMNWIITVAIFAAVIITVIFAVALSAGRKKRKSDDTPLDREFDTNLIRQEISSVEIEESADIISGDDFPEGGEVNGAKLVKYDRSFTAKLIQMRDCNKQWYSDIKNRLLAYEGIKDRVSWKKETFRLDGRPLARLIIKGKTLCLMLAADADFSVSDVYKTEKVEKMPSMKDTPYLYRIQSELRVKRAKQMIDEIFRARGLGIIEKEYVSYVYPYEKTASLVKKGLIKLEYAMPSSEEVTGNWSAAEIVADLIEQNNNKEI